MLLLTQILRSFMLTQNMKRQCMIWCLSALYFICVAPTIDDGVDVSIIKDAIDTLTRTYNGGIIVKSTIPPDKVDEICFDSRIVYNPEFLIQSNAKEQFVNAPYHILGGETEFCDSGRVFVTRLILFVLLRNMFICQYLTCFICKVRSQFFFGNQSNIFQPTL